MKHNERCDLVHSLLSLAEAKALLGADDREDSLVEFLLVSSTYAIEEYCMRRLLRKRIKERFEASGYLTLREYPVREVLAVDIIHADGSASPAYYDLSPEAGALVNVPHILRPLPPDYALRGKTISVKYIAGYSMKDVTPDLKEACFELTAWKYQRTLTVLLTPQVKRKRVLKIKCRKESKNYYHLIGGRLCSRR